MHLTVNSALVAKVDAASVVLKPLLGGYELGFLLTITPTPVMNERRWVALECGRVAVRGNAGDLRPLGVARPDARLLIAQTANGHGVRAVLTMPLQAVQLAKLEDIRDGGGLAFEVALAGDGGVTGIEGASSPVGETLRLQTAQSDWIAQLHAAGFVDIILLEAALPHGSAGSLSLQRAQRHFLNGEYSACVAECRQLVEELGLTRSGDNAWASHARKALQEDRKGMTKQAREDVLLAAIQHYAHQAHHPVSDGGVAHYSREEAKFILHLSACCAATRIA